MFISVNPANEAVIARYSTLDASAAEHLLDGLATSFPNWRETRFAQRAAILQRLARLLRGASASLAQLISQEMGKPLAQSRGEVEKCAWVCEYYAEHGASFLSNQPVTVEYGRAYISYQPLGVILAIMPWNFPLWQVMRFAAPTFMAGNQMLLKHAPNVTGTALALMELIKEAAEGQRIADLLCADEATIAQIIANPNLAGVTLTGSTRAGKAVAALAGQHLKKCVLELGGSDPYIVLEDADVEEAASVCVASRLLNSGQTCISAKRFIVHEAVADAFEQAMFERLQATTYGNALEGDFDLGPMARKDLRDALHEQVQKTVSQGATLKLGGIIPEGPGFFYPPTLLTHVQPEMTAFKEETFGPVAAITVVRDDNQAIELANQSSLGLGGAIFTGDTERGLHLAESKLQVGAAFVNGFVRSDPRLPFGGIKESGFGRELGLHGIHEFVNIKTVCCS